MPTPKGTKLPNILKKPPAKPKPRAKRTGHAPTEAQIEAGTEALTKYASERSARTRMTVNKYDWELARETFISAEQAITLKKLSEDMGIPYAYLRSRSSEERWQYLRAEEQKRIFKKKRQDHLTKMADDSIKFDEASIASAKLGQMLVAARLAEIAKLHEAMGPAMVATIALVKKGVPVPKEALYSAIRFTELRELAVAAKLYQDMGRAAFGTDIQNIALTGGTEDSVEHVISVSAELGKDDPLRLAAMLEAFARTGLATINLADVEDPNTVDAEVVDDESQPAIESGQIGEPDS